MPRDRVRMISNWVAPEFTEHVRSFEPDVDFRIVLVGRLEQQKNQQFALRLLAELPKSVRLKLVGAGADLDDLQTLAARLGVSTRVTFTGQRSDIPAQLATADLALVPSRFEGFGRVAVEAMSVGTPVICSDAAGLVDVCAGAPASAASVVPLVLNDWLAAIQARLGEPLTPEEIHAMRAYARESYSLEKSVAGYRNLVKDVLKAADEGRE